MILTEEVNINGQIFNHTYSDENKYLIRDGQKYDEAYDPKEFNRKYQESDESFENELI